MSEADLTALTEEKNRLDRENYRLAEELKAEREYNALAIDNEIRRANQLEAERDVLREELAAARRLAGLGDLLTDDADELASDAYTQAATFNWERRDASGRAAVKAAIERAVAGMADEVSRLRTRVLLLESALSASSAL